MKCNFNETPSNNKMGIVFRCWIDQQICILVEQQQQAYSHIFLCARCSMFDEWTKVTIKAIKRHVSASTIFFYMKMYTMCECSLRLCNKTHIKIHPFKTTENAFSYHLEHTLRYRSFPLLPYVVVSLPFGKYWIRTSTMADRVHKSRALCTHDEVKTKQTKWREKKNTWTVYNTTAKEKKLHPRHSAHNSNQPRLIWLV